MQKVSGLSRLAKIGMLNNTSNMDDYMKRIKNTSSSGNLKSNINILLIIKQDNKLNTKFIANSQNSNMYGTHGSKKSIQK